MAGKNRQSDSVERLDRGVARTVWGVSFLALCAALSAGQADAQTAGNTNTQAAAADNGGDGSIVVTGIRRSLANAQQIKRNVDVVVDAITAQDIGALPDRSVTEALQRV